MIRTKRMPKPKKRITAFKVGRKIGGSKKYTYICKGGPLHGIKLALLTPKTMTFQIKNEKGYYSEVRDLNINYDSFKNIRNSAPSIYWNEVK